MPYKPGSFPGRLADKQLIRLFLPLSSPLILLLTELATSHLLPNVDATHLHVRSKMARMNPIAANTGNVLETASGLVGWGQVL